MKVQMRIVAEEIDIRLSTTEDTGDTEDLLAREK